MIRVGIAGYGNVGKGVKAALSQQPDMELCAIFTRRDPGSFDGDLPMVAMSAIEAWKDRLDVVILCGGSATDLPVQGPEMAAHFCTVDSFDTHAKIPAYFASMEKAASAAGTLSLISAGWDPGLFSLNRLLGNAILPQGSDYPFWGRGVSQGHSDAIRRVPGVKNAIQYTVPVPEAVEAVRSGDEPVLSTRQKHTRLCYVVAEEGADRQEIERQIVTMPNYFSDYDTTVHFISEEELRRDHSGMPHGGFVIRTGKSAVGSRQRMEFSLELESNPEFTANVLVCCARAVVRLHAEGKQGACTMLDVPPAYYACMSGEELRRTLL